MSKPSLLSSQLRYGAVAQAFHWLTVLLVGVAYLLSPGGREERIYSAAADSARTLHESAGILLFALVLLRILWRAFDPAPEGARMEPWMKLAAKAAHWGLYALLFAIPLTAIAGAWLEAHPLTLLGIGDIAPMLAPDHALGAAIANIHTILGNVIIWLAGFHAAAALFHHYWLNDDTLRSILPTWKAAPVLGASAKELSQYRRNAP
ncbi:MAG TPA: cytochrome b [Xanthobacteraceae bacterium]|nr:cytochrome b [Xanthobacteraceae bacterium]